VLGSVASQSRIFFRKSAQKIIEAMRINYNYVKEHSTLCKPPAESCGIKIEGNKLMTLIKKINDTYTKRKFYY
jgi:hypothetical protein